jgi:hypothetical protein
MKPDAIAALLPGLPRTTGRAIVPRDDLARGIAGLTEEVSALREEVRYANSFRGQLPNLLIGGVIGAVLGGLVTLLITPLLGS